MARMLGKAAWDGIYCSCCNDRRTNHHQRQREKHVTQKWLDEYEERAPLPCPLYADQSDPPPFGACTC